MDRLDEWRIFVAVAGRRSFVAAARALSRSPQTVTRAVAALEARLGTRLLHRTTRSVSLTGEGERQIERARRALAEIDLLESGLDTPASLAGKLSVTAPVLFGQMHVAAGGDGAAGEVPRPRGAPAAARPGGVARRGRNRRRRPHRAPARFVAQGADRSARCAGCCARARPIYGARVSRARWKRCRGTTASRSRRRRPSPTTGRSPARAGASGR